MKLGDFGTFVIFTALYAAGSLGLPEITLMAYQVRVAEMPTAFVAIFGLPAVFGLVLGQFIANLGFHVAPLQMLSPLIALSGLGIVYYLRKSSVLGGLVAYVLLTSAWVSYVLITIYDVAGDAAVMSALAGQIVAVGVGYVGYRVATAAVPHSQKPPTTGFPH
jgi:uncharacterized membrane protein